MIVLSAPKKSHANLPSLYLKGGHYEPENSSLHPDSVYEHKYVVYLSRDRTG